MTADVRPLDLEPVARQLEEDLLARWRDLLRTTSFIGGAEVQSFETSFARFLGAEGCVGVANGTDALVVALKALDLQPGDEVLVPAFTFFATAEAVVWAGGIPRIVDIEPQTFNLSVEDAARRIGPRTVGVIGVHLYGTPCDLEGLQSLCAAHDLWLLEDAAQAHGARYRGRCVGTFGALATWSFYPSKNLGCFGDGGAVSGMDSDRLARVRSLANHGRTAHYHHGEVGTNSRLDALQAAVLNLRLPSLVDDNRRRAELVARYREGLAAVGDLTFLQVPQGTESVYHQLPVLTGRRDDLQVHLQGLGIGTGIHYPLPLHLQPALASMSDGDARPVSERAAETNLCLPIYAQLDEAAVDRVIDAIRDFF